MAQMHLGGDIIITVFHITKTNIRSLLWAFTMNDKLHIWKECGLFLKSRTYIMAIMSYFFHIWLKAWEFHKADH